MLVIGHNLPFGEYNKCINVIVIKENICERETGVGSVEHKYNQSMKIYFLFDCLNGAQQHVHRLKGLISQFS